MAEVVVVIEGVREAAEALGYAKALIDKRTSQALKKTATRTRTQISRVARRQVSFSASYLNESRLRVSERASPSNLSIRIEGRDRPTSLARFAVGAAKKEPRVRVQVGAVATRIPRSFIINLKRGSAATGNVGLAVRTDGGKPQGAWKPVEMAPGLWLLYGPSVDQVLMGDGPRGAFARSEDWALDFFTAEFHRLMQLGDF